MTAKQILQRESAIVGLMIVIAMVIVYLVAGCGTTFSGNRLGLNVQPTPPSQVKMLVDKRPVCTAKGSEAFELTVTCPDGHEHTYVGEGSTRRVHCKRGQTDAPE